MRKTILFITFLTCLLGLTISTEAQKRKPRKPKVAVVLTNETKEVAGKVAIQINNVSKFLYLLALKILTEMLKVEKSRHGQKSPTITKLSNKTFLLGFVIYELV
jgi:hypothetical protein